MKDFKFWGTAVVGSKGQVVIPAKAREEFDIQEGEQLLVVGPPGPAKSALMFIKADTLEQMLQHMQNHIESVKSVKNNFESFAKSKDNGGKNG